MPYKEKEIEKVYWGIGDVTKMLGVSHSMLRFWETEFEFLNPKKNKKGDRFYTKKEIEHIKMIIHLTKEKGYTLKGAKQKLKGSGLEENDNQFQTIETLKKIRAFLEQLKSEL